jgi:hypothetical protein
MLKDVRFETFEEQRGLFGKLSDLREAVRDLINSDIVTVDVQIELYDVEIKLYELMSQVIKRP